jgi:hypothetical protein
MKENAKKLMNENAQKLTCAEFQDQLPELIGSGDQISEHPHIQSCALCSALLTDLETIAEAARQLFPIEDPPDELWGHIESALMKEEGGVIATEAKGKSPYR